MKNKIFICLNFVLLFALILTAIFPKTNAVVMASTIKNKEKASIIIEFNSGEVVYEEKADQKVQVASIVKLMTTLLTIEEIEKGNIKLTDKITSSENAAGMGGSQVFIDPFEQYSVEEMLKSVIVASANDAAVALSEHVAGNEDAFVTKMNKRAKELGMTNTLYANSTGLPAPEEYSTARDTAILLKEVIKHDIYHKYSTIWMDELVHPSGRKTEVVNTNKLTRYFKGCDSGKTGFTDEAGYCLVASAQRDGLRFIAVSLGAPDSKTRFANVTNLLSYAFANFQNSLIVSKNDSLLEVNVKMSKNSMAQLKAQDDFYALEKKGEKGKYEITVNAPKDLKAPIKQGEVVGQVIITKDGKVLKEIALVTAENHDKLTFKDAFGEIAKNWN
ncbi:MAG: D-alanyl-D-alanine carboxypeptidase family protein [Christensenellales bacterium]|jgi:D-alanyl-D-alanine carboxypeptidase (penicillin-binding protein 5/6)